MPQNKITDPLKDIDVTELEELTEKQRNFVYHKLQGRSNSDAYREAYDVSNMSTQAIWVEASRMASHPKISLWVKAARLNQFVDGTVTLESHIRRLAELSHKAQEAGNYGAAVNAEHHIGKAAGLYIERHQDVNREKELQIVERILEAYGPDHALRAAERLKLDVTTHAKLLQAIEKAQETRH